MKLSRPFGAIALLALGACGARGGSSSTGTTDAGNATTDVVATPDVPGAPVDAGVAVDVGTAVDVGVAVDVGTALDLGTPARCGDGTCDDGETCTSCRADCASDCPPPPADVPAPRCGDSTCNGTESCTTCPGDCGACTGNPLTDPCVAGAEQGPNRDCGWRAGVTLTCLAGRATMVGCSGSMGAGSLCQPAYGACAGDPVMRVCPTAAPCTAAMALTPASGSFDDQCSTCPSAYVTCPASGQIFVLTGDYDSNVAAQRGTCTPAAR